MEAANDAVEDRSETPSAMEPLVLSAESRDRGPLSDLAVELAAASSGFRRSLPPGVVGPLAELVRAMNCYYSNLIEGHNTHPVDIERAMKNDYSGDPEKRNLQLEAKAHVAVQRWVDEGGVKGRVATVGALCEIHRRFSEQLPNELLMVSDPDSGRTVNVAAGELRRDDVRVGRHLAISPGAVPRFIRASSSSTPRSAARKRSLRRQRRITACCGFTRLRMGTGAWRGSCRTQACSRCLTPEACGRLRAVWRGTLPNTNST
jgi:hypothetical protein